jgi:hypothetical protein
MGGLSTMYPAKPSTKNKNSRHQESPNQTAKKKKICNDDDSATDLAPIAIGGLEDTADTVDNAKISGALKVRMCNLHLHNKNLLLY